MTASQAPRPLAPPPIRLRPQRAETTESYARRLARASHLAQLPACVPLRPATAHRSDPPMAARRHLRPFRPGAGTRSRRPHPGQPARTAAARTRLSTDPDQYLAPHRARAHARADTATPARRARRRNLLLHYRPLPPFHHQQPLPPQRAFQAGSDDSNQPQSPMTAAFTRTSHASPIASQTGPARSEPQSRADLSGTG